VRGILRSKKSAVSSSYRLAGRRFSTFFDAARNRLRNRFMVNRGNQPM
jgi:hypothetical protein